MELYEKKFKEFLNEKIGVGDNEPMRGEVLEFLGGYVSKQIDRFVGNSCKTEFYGSGDRLTPFDFLYFTSTVNSDNWEEPIEFKLNYAIESDRAFVGYSRLNQLLENDMGWYLRWSGGEKEEFKIPGAYEEGILYYKMENSMKFTPKYFRPRVEAPDIHFGKGGRNKDWEEIGRVRELDHVFRGIAKHQSDWIRSYLEFEKKELPLIKKEYLEKY